VSWLLALLTVLLVVAGSLLYAYGSVGWAQLLLVFASGTAGAAVVSIVDDHHHHH
jgi:uncharacterized membrane protein